MPVEDIAVLSIYKRTCTGTSYTSHVQVTEDEKRKNNRRKITLGTTQTRKGLEEPKLGGHE